MKGLAPRTAARYKELKTCPEGTGTLRKHTKLRTEQVLHR